MPIKFFTGTHNGIIPPSAYSLFSGLEILKGVPHHNSTPDALTDALYARNLAAKVQGQNKIVIGLMSVAYRQATYNYLKTHHNVETIITFDGGGSTKQYLNYQGFQRNFESGSRQIPGIFGIKVH